MIIAAFLLIFVLPIENDVSAEEKLFIKSVETSNSIDLSWNLKGEKFKIYRNQELIWEGKKSTYLDENLKSGEIYSYRIGSYDKNGNLIDITNLKTQTKETVNNSLLEDAEVEYSAKMSANVSNHYVRLEWDNLKDKDGIYKIYRDDVLIDSTKESYYLDENVEPGKTYTYMIEAESEISEKEKEKIKSQLKENDLHISREKEQELYLKPHVLIRTIETNKNEATEAELKSKDLPSPIIKLEKEMEKENNNSLNFLYSILFRYTTFIPEKTVPNPLQSGFLGGDNRSWNFFSNKYRTRSDVIAGWAGGINELKLNPYTGWSYRYSDKAGTKEIQRGKASTAGIRITRNLVSNFKLKWKVNHDVGVPFSALYPNINYSYEGTLDKNYNVHLKGWHDRAPNHEFALAIAYTEDTPIKIFNFTGESFFNLLPGTPTRSFQYYF